MSAESKNIALIRYLVSEVQQDSNYDLIDNQTRILDHIPVPGHVSNREGVHKMMRYLHSAISDIKIDIQQCVCTCDVVATNKVISGNHIGDSFGHLTAKQRVEFRVMDFIRVQEGKLVEHWGCPGPVMSVSKTS